MLQVRNLKVRSGGAVLAPLRPVTGNRGRG